MTPGVDCHHSIDRQTGEGRNLRKPERPEIWKSRKSRKGRALSEIIIQSHIERIKQTKLRLLLKHEEAKSGPSAKINEHGSERKQQGEQTEERTFSEPISSGARGVHRPPPPSLGGGHSLSTAPILYLCPPLWGATYRGPRECLARGHPVGPEQKHRNELLKP